MKETEQLYWDRCWKSENIDVLAGYLSKYKGACNRLIEMLHENDVAYVCDAACGFGAYSLMLASNGFRTAGFDISSESINITKKLLSKYNIDTSGYFVSSITEILYEDETFDAAVAHAVLDHLTVRDAEKAVEELFRITKKSGLIFISFDGIEEDDLKEPHRILEDGCMLYTSGNRNGMIFKYYSVDDINSLVRNRTCIFRSSKPNGERFVILKK